MLDARHSNSTARLNIKCVFIIIVICDVVHAPKNSDADQPDATRSN